jgi:LuxR family quorum sensing-dependent transcriptional regulator
MQPLEYGRDAFDFIDSIDHLATTDAVLDSMHRVLGRAGFETLIFIGVEEAGTDFDSAVLGMRWPDEWLRTYTDGQYQRVDPLIRHARRSASPFEWSEAPYDADLEPRAAELMQLRDDFGFGRGFVIPVRGQAGTPLAVSMSGARPDLTTALKPALHLMALYALDRAQSLRSPRPAPNAVLTDREREVLTWLAAGQEPWEISETLNIAERLIDAHARQASRKLGAANRTQAVAIAARDHFITI